jgi:hypothetical protein
MCATKLSLRAIYRLALLDGLTAKEAALRYDCKASSLVKIRKRHGFKPLVSKYQLDEYRFLEKLTVQGVREYLDLLEPESKQYKFVSKILKSREAKA